MERIGMLFLAALGLTCIYAGYRLFCDLPAMNGDRPQANRVGVFLVNIIPGALLALIGVGLLSAEVHGAMSHQPAGVHRHQPAEGASWHRGRSGFPARTA